jgi:hypothetical protein
MRISASIAGFLLAFFLVARLMSERRAPANTFAWLLVIVFIPWLGVPLYLRLRRPQAAPPRQGQSRPSFPIVPAICAGPETRSVCLPVAKTVGAAGGYAPVGGNRVRLLLTGRGGLRRARAPDPRRQALDPHHDLHPEPRRDGPQDRGAARPARAGGNQGAPPPRRAGLPPLLPRLRRPDPGRPAARSAASCRSCRSPRGARPTCATTARWRSSTGPRRWSAAATSPANTWGPPAREAAGATSGP